MTRSLVLLPGLLCDHRLWAAQLPALEVRGDVLVGDLTRADTVGALAEQVLAAAPGHFALAGLSMGGYVAFEILRRAPERVTRLALVDTQARPDTETNRSSSGLPKPRQTCGFRSSSSALGASSAVKNQRLPSNESPCVHIGRARNVPSASTVVIIVGRTSEIRSHSCCWFSSMLSPIRRECVRYPARANSRRGSSVGRAHG